MLFCSQFSEQSIVSVQIQIENNNLCTFYHLYKLTMKHFRLQNKAQDQNEETTLSFDHKLLNSLKSFIKLLPFVEFTVNYGYAVENVWVTMLMITHGNPDPVDCFVWIVPIIIAIFLRPYLIRYVHNINYKVYRQITLVSACLMVGAFGCYLVGLSCQLHKKSQLFRRLLQCSVGWIIMDVAFEFCQFLTEKIEVSYNQLQQTQKTNVDKEGQQKGEDTAKKINFQFYGLLSGYIISLIICWVINGRTVKQFYRCCKYTYWTVGGLSLITGLRLQIQSYIHLPKRQIQDKQSEQKVFQISYDANYYLPGLQQLLRGNFKTYSLLLLHFVVIFVNDVIMIYTTMWFTQPKGVKFAKHGEALMNGLQYGGISLLLYTVIDNLKINNKVLGYTKYFQATLFSLIIFSTLTYFWYGSLSFLILGSLIAVTNQFYRHNVFNNQSQNNPLFQRCVEITERIQKIFILSFMPTIVMLILQRNDIQDCLIWASTMASLGMIAFKLATRRDATAQQLNESSNKTVKVDKIQ